MEIYMRPAIVPRSNMYATVIWFIFLVACFAIAIKNKNYAGMFFVFYFILLSALVISPLVMKGNLDTSEIIYINEDFILEPKENTVVNSQVKTIVVDRLEENIMITKSEIEEMGCFTILRERDLLFGGQTTDVIFKICHVNEMRFK